MKRESVVCHFVHAFEDVDFAVFRPVWADGPECWPGSAAKGHVLNIEDDEAAVVLFLAFDSDARTSLGGYVLEVYAPLHCGG